MVGHCEFSLSRLTARECMQVGASSVPSLFVRLLLFLSSYSPLAAIVAIQLATKKHIWAAGGVAVVGALGLLGLLLYLSTIHKLNPETVTIESASRRDGEAMSYIVTYLLPFLALTSGSLTDSICLGIFLVVLAVLYVNSEMLYINPVLNLLGWHVYEATIQGGEVRMLITRRRARSGRDVAAVRVGDDILFDVRK